MIVQTGLWGVGGTEGLSNGVVEHVSMIKSMVCQLDLSSSHPYQSVVLSAQGVKVSPGLEAKGLRRVNPIFHKYYL